MMINKVISFLFLGMLSGFCNAQSAGIKTFINPLEAAPSLSSSFAELRNDHFHSGIDYKTGGVTGKDVFAAAEGYVYRIGVSPYGYGKVLYIRHSNGYSTVYAHLERFRPDIEEYVQKRQYELKNYAVTLYPQRDQFRVNSGEVIAWSGNSGGSTGPHMHFEVREAFSETPVNPLKFGLGVTDMIKPVIEKIMIYPLTRYSSVNETHQSYTYRVSGSGGSFTVENEKPIVVNGNIGIGVKCWDSSDNSPNRCGIYSIEMSVDSSSVYTFTADKFSFSESRYLNSHIDYSLKAARGEYIHRLYLQPGNRLSMYNNVVNRGIIRFSDDKQHLITITVKDIKGNTSKLNMKVKSLSAPPLSPAVTSCSKVIPYGRASDFAADGIRIHFPPLSLYDTLFLKYDVRQSNGRFLSPIHEVHDESVAIHDLIRLSLRPDTIIGSMESKLCLVRITREGQKTYAGGDYNYGFVSSEVRLFGAYAVGIDSIAPLIKRGFAAGADLRGHRSVTFTVTDDFSGLKSYDAYIDGSWALLEYDAKSNLMIYHPDSNRIKQNSLHQIEIKVADNRDNLSVFKTEFTW